MINPPADRLLSVTEAAYMLGIRPSTLYVWNHKGKIEKVKIGRALRFRESTLLRMLSDYTVAAKPDVII